MISSPNNNVLYSEANSEVCRVCERKTQMCCERCREAFYCGPEHQKEDWRNHRDSCVMSPMSIMVKVEDIRLQEGEDIAESEGGGDVEPVLEYALQLKAKLQENEDHMLKEKAKAKDMALRAANMKKLLESRNNERQSTLYYFFKKNMQSAIITGKRVMLISRRIFGQFNDEVLCEELQQRFLFRTNKLLQEIEIMMDITILAKIYLSMDKPEEIKHLLNPINFHIPVLRNNPYPNIHSTSDRRDLIKYNIWREEVAKLSAILNSLILIISKTKLYEITNGLFEKYMAIAEKHMSDLEVGTIEFQWATYLQNSGQIEKAREHFLLCSQIREKYGETLALSDVLYNLGLTEFYINQKDKSQAIEYVQRALRIRKDRIQKPSMEFHALLETLGKFMMEIEDYWSAYKYLFEAFSLCRNFLDGKHKLRKRSQVLLIFFYRTLIKHVTEFPREGQQFNDLINLMETEVFTLAEYENYMLHESKKEEAHLHLQIPREFFEMLTGEQIVELSSIQESVKNLNFRQGIEHIVKSSFYTGMNTEKKSYFLSINPKIDPLSILVNKIMGF